MEDCNETACSGFEVDVSNKKKGRCGRKPLQIDLSLVPTIHLNQRSTIRSLGQLGVNPSTLFRRFKAKYIRRMSSTLKPLLKEKNKRARMEFCLSMLDEATLGDGGGPKSINMHNIVHIDEKWFNMTKKNHKYYLLPEEDDPIRAVQNTTCIGKVMFLIVVARPRFDSQGNITFPGKIGFGHLSKRFRQQEEAIIDLEGPLRLSLSMSTER